jgi:hypothetical protein
MNGDELRADDAGGDVSKMIRAAAAAWFELRRAVRVTATPAEVDYAYVTIAGRWLDLYPPRNPCCDCGEAIDHEDLSVDFCQACAQDGAQDSTNADEMGFG